jgi:hypothetical protein
MATVPGQNKVEHKCLKQIVTGGNDQPKLSKPAGTWTGQIFPFGLCRCIIIAIYIDKPTSRFRIGDLLLSITSALWEQAYLIAAL